MAEIARVPQIASPTIEEVFGAFLADQRKRLKPKAYRQYEETIDLLRENLNGYAHQSLSKLERTLFEKHFDAVGGSHREFCQVFGPDKIPQEVPGFLTWYLIRKVVCDAAFTKAAARAAKELAQWLVEEGHVPQGETAEKIEEISVAAADLPRAEKAAGLLSEACLDWDGDPSELEDDDYLDFDHFTVKKVEPGKLWLEYCSTGPKYTTVGPITVPKAASKLLESGWEIACALAKIRGRWRIVEGATVYPL